MSALSIQPTFPTFADVNGQPLDNGYIWIGAANLDPQTNPVQVYWDAALTIAAPQPIRTLAGYPSRNGTPARLYVNSDYSIRVMNKNGSVVYSAPAATERFGNLINADEIIYNPAGTGAAQTDVETKLREFLNVRDFGAVGDGSDQASKIQAAIDYASSLGGYMEIRFEPGEAYTTSRLVPKSGVLLNLQGATLKLADNTNAPILYDGGSGVGARFGLINGTLDCNQNANKAANICGGLWLNQWDDVEARNLTIKNCSRVGLYFYRSTQVVVENYTFIDSGTSTATAAVKFSYALGIGINTTTGDNCNNVVVKNIKASNRYGYGILVLGSTNVSIENVDFDNFNYLTFSIGITLSETSRINVNNVVMNDIVGDNFEINGCEDVVVNNVDISNAGNRPLLIGQNTPGTFSKRLTLSNFKTTTTGGSFSASLSYLFDSTLTNFNCDKGASGTSTAGTSDNNCVTDSIFPVTSPAIFLAYGFYRLENVQFSNVTYRSFDRYSAKVTGRTTIAASGVFNLDMTTLFNIFMTLGSRAVTGKLSLQSSWSGSANNGSYQSCEFLVNDFGTAANSSAVTQVNNAVARALTIAGDAANKRITLTNGTVVDLGVSYELNIVVPN